jgi:hypothetical protein
MPMNLDDERLCKLTTVTSEYEATAIVSALEAEGIRARTDGGITAGFRTEAPSGVTVVVLEDDLPRAKEIFADLKANGAGIDWSQVDVDDPESNEPSA